MLSIKFALYRKINTQIRSSAIYDIIFDEFVITKFLLKQNI
jgi:hypothetical protein